MKNVFIKVVICLLCTTNSLADVISVTNGTIDPLPLAVNDFVNASPEDLALTKELTSVISNDLKSSGVFRPISHAAFIESKIGVNHKPLFAAWQQINASLLVNGEVQRTFSNRLKVKYVVWDTILEKEIITETLELSEDLWRRGAHKIADVIYKKITGYDGYFNTRITYVSESGEYLKRKKRLAIMDYDGANHRYLTNGSDLVLTPRFSPDGKSILYLSYKNNTPQVYILDLKSNNSKLLGSFKGMSFAPRFSPDGKSAIMSIAKNGATHIYEINLMTKEKTQLTKGVNINTSPSYSPDSSKIAYNSDIYGTRQIFTMDRDGSNKQKISFGKGAYTEPNWSSRDYLAYTKMSRDYGFTIGVMRPEDSSQNSERLITSGYLVESPAWAHNGRVLLFTKGAKATAHTTKGLNRIYMIDFTGQNERIVPTPHDASDPNWSRPID